MKFSLAACALAVSSAAAFAPSTVSRPSTAVNMEVDRRSAFGQVGIAAATLAGLPSIASADGAVSAATMGRARGIYGDRIAALKDSVNKGDFEAVADEKSAFILFNSGVYPRAVDKSKKTDAIAETNEIFAAVRTKDAAGLKKAYNQYVATNNIKPLPDISSDAGQGMSGDYDYRARTRAGAVYVR